MHKQLHNRGISDEPPLILNLNSVTPLILNSVTSFPKSSGSFRLLKLWSYGRCKLNSSNSTNPSSKVKLVAPSNLKTSTSSSVYWIVSVSAWVERLAAITAMASAIIVFQIDPVSFVFVECCFVVFVVIFFVLCVLYSKIRQSAPIAPCYWCAYGISSQFKSELPSPIVAISFCANARIALKNACAVSLTNLICYRASSFAPIAAFCNSSAVLIVFNPAAIRSCVLSKSLANYFSHPFLSRPPNVRKLPRWLLLATPWNACSRWFQGV